jgi:succinate dehydrogenase / fumarate reductase iron-sulfur subunit
MSTATFKVWRGSNEGGDFETYEVELEPGYVVLDAVHKIQAEQASDLACRWNCKAGKCGSCSAEINGSPGLMCMTRVEDLPEDAPITIEPMRTFPVIKDLVTDVSWNYEVKASIQPMTPKAPDHADGSWAMQQYDVERPQEFRKCIECFLCQNVCHVLRDHQMHDKFAGPRHFVFAAQAEMNPIDTGDRLAFLRDDLGIGYCNITKCCTKVCPENIQITDNAIIPLKERVVTQSYDPIAKLMSMVKGNA